MSYIFYRKGRQTYMVKVTIVQTVDTVAELVAAGYTITDVK